MTPEDIVERAARQIDLPPAPGLAWQGLCAAHRSMHSEMPPSRLARHMFETSSVRRMGNYLVLEALADRAGAGAPQDGIDEVLVIVGLPRTGSTMLHNLLAVEPGTAFLSHADVENPWWMLRGAGRPDATAEVSDWLDFLDVLDPRLRAAHPMHPAWPDECTILFANCFASHELSVTFGLPSYFDWLEGTDPAPFYGFYGRAVTALVGHAHPHASRLVLKSPFHLRYRDALRAVLPGAVVVNLVRRSDHVVASHLLLVDLFHQAMYGRPLPRTLRDRWLALLARLAQESVGLAERDECITVRYDDLVADPLGTIDVALRRVGRQTSERHRRAARQWLRDDTRAGVPSASLEQFDLRREDLPDELHAYDEAFALP